MELKNINFTPFIHKMRRIESDQIKRFLFRVLRIIGRHSFLFFLVFVFFGLVFGGVLFYQYYLLVEKIEPEIAGKQIYFQEEIYLEILEEWKKQEKKFKEVDSKTYLNPFLETREKVSTLSDDVPLVESKAEDERDIKNLFEFYTTKGEDLPFLRERARIWEEKGLGIIEEYQGFYFQNLRLLKELTTTPD